MKTSICWISKGISKFAYKCWQNTTVKMLVKFIVKEIISTVLKQLVSRLIS
ncbi:unknown [Bacteroides sp. CAG:754]|jgi:hypothetical protein|nr:unknown [Bacteroides sp. CAG:754]